MCYPYPTTGIYGLYRFCLKQGYSNLYTDSSAEHNYIIECMHTKDTTIQYTVQYGCIGLSDVDHLRIYSYFDMICRGSLVVFITHLVIRSSVVIEREGATLIITEPIHQKYSTLN